MSTSINQSLKLSINNSNAELINQSLNYIRLRLRSTPYSLFSSSFSSSSSSLLCSSFGFSINKSQTFCILFKKILTVLLTFKHGKNIVSGLNLFLTSYSVFVQSLILTRHKYFCTKPRWGSKQKRYGNKKLHSYVSKSL